MIRRYNSLAPGHYFCQIYTEYPSVLSMHEFINYSGMFYSWQVNYNLLSTNFFECGPEGQKTILVNFYREAVKGALDWLLERAQVILTYTNHKTRRAKIISLDQLIDKRISILEEK